MGITHLLDTNIIIYYLQQQLPASAANYLDEVFRTSMPAISVITEMELLCWKSATEADVALLRQFIEDVTVISLTESVKQRAIEVRKASGIKLPDAIIAASALSQHLILVSRNEKDFNKVPELTVINPWQLA